MKHDRITVPLEKPQTGPTLNIVLGLIAIILFSVNLFVKSEAGSRSMEYVPEMFTSAAYDAMDVNPHFPDGKTLREPVAGTIPYSGSNPALPGSIAAESLAIPALNPFSADDAASMQRGTAVFTTFCIVCHGSGGIGDGIVTKKGVPPPPSFLAEHALSLSDGQLFSIISNGQNNMASYAAQIPVADRWKAILHIRALQRPTPPVAAAPSTEAEVSSEAAPS
ncbi:MAG: cytochrome c, partial [Bacteroidota bacterium]